MNPSNQLDKYLTDIKKLLSENNLILFLGAGISLPAAPSTRELMEAFGSACSIQYEGEEFSKFVDKCIKKDIAACNQVLDEKLQEFPQTIRLILSQLWRFRFKAILTTNFDPWLSYQTIENIHKISVYDDLPGKASELNNHVCYLHGIFFSSDPHSSIENLVFGKSSFEKAYSNTSVLYKLLKDIFKNENILFIGFKPTEPYIRKIIEEVNLNIPSIDNPKTIRRYLLHPAPTFIKGEENRDKRNQIIQYFKDLEELEIQPVQIPSDNYSYVDRFFIECIRNKFSQYHFSALEAPKFSKSPIKVKSEINTELFPLKSWSGPNSQWSLDEISQMPISKLVGELINWKPRPLPVGPYASVEGTGRNIQEDVYKCPERYVAELHWFKKLEEPTYIRHVVSGLRMASANQKPFEWSPVLDLCKWVVDKDIEAVSKRNNDEVEAWNQDPDWNYARHSICMLLGSGLSKKIGEGGIPYKERGLIWQILKNLFETSSDQNLKKSEIEQDLKNWVYYELAINDTFGQSFEDIIQYALWVRRNLEQCQLSAQLEDEGFQNFDEVRQILESCLGPDRDSSLALHSMYGRWFPWLALLDRRWAEREILRIFPIDPKLKKYREVAWDSYIHYCNPYKLAFDLLKENYEIAVESLKGNETVSEEYRIEAKLAEHLMAFYLRGQIVLSEKLLNSFFENAPKRALAHAIRYLAITLVNAEKTKLPEEAIKKIQELWEWRATKSSAEEMDEFALWSEADVLDYIWFFKQLNIILRSHYPQENDFRLFGAFVNLSRDYPVEVLNSLELLARHAPSVRVPWWEDRLPAIFKNIFASTDIIKVDALRILASYQGKATYPYIKDQLIAIANQQSSKK